MAMVNETINQMFHHKKHLARSLLVLMGLKSNELKRN